MYQPVVPLGGYAGWLFLGRTRAAQEAAFNASAQMQRETTYFQENIGKVRDAEALVDDRRLLRVALGAFGLDADIDNRYFVKKVLEDGSLDTGDLANKLSDKRYLAMATAFGFDLATPSTAVSDFGAKIAAKYRERQFEVAVGAQDENLRMAMGIGRDLGEIARRDTTDDGRWYAVMGNPPLRRVFETALGLPASFGALDLDRQLGGFREASERFFGASEVADFGTPEMQEKLTRLFLTRADLQSNAAATRSGSAALALLRGIA
jgi:hypothetical protein